MIRKNTYQEITDQENAEQEDVYQEITGQENADQEIYRPGNF